MNNIIEQMLSKYNIKNSQDEINAMKEIIQEIVLCGLSRGDFFNIAAFHGGTALRIFYGLNRFSEDLDFTLLTPNKNFDLTKYFKYVEKELEAYGLNLIVSEKHKNTDTNIQAGLIKGNTKECILNFFPKENFQSNDIVLKQLKIKLEIDINPPAGANYEYKYNLLPSPYQVNLCDAPSLFAGKIHAILCRNWNSRVKGRDLYDYIFYLSKEIKLNINYIREKLIFSNMISRQDVFNLDILKSMLNNKFKEINYNNAKEDIIPFINNNDSLELWNDNFFIQITEKLTIE